MVEGYKPAILNYRSPDADPNHEAASDLIAIIAVIRAKPLLQLQSAMIGHGLMLGLRVGNTKILGGIANACGVDIAVVMVVALYAEITCPNSTIYSVRRATNHELVGFLIFEFQ